MVDEQNAGDFEMILYFDWFPTCVDLDHCVGRTIVLVGPLWWSGPLCWQDHCVGRTTVVVWTTVLIGQLCW